MKKALAALFALAFVTCASCSGGGMPLTPTAPLSSVAAPSSIYTAWTPPTVAIDRGWPQGDVVVEAFALEGPCQSAWAPQDKNVPAYGSITFKGAANVVCPGQATGFRVSDQPNAGPNPDIVSCDVEVVGETVTLVVSEPTDTACTLTKTGRNKYHLHYSLVKQ